MLEALPWHDQQWQLVDTAIANDKLHHALLLTGPDGIGLARFARRLAMRLLCHQPNGGNICGTCKSCILFQAGNHPDILVLEPEAEGKQIKVDLIRDLVLFMQHTTQYGRRKIAVIDPAEAMNRSSANSLLKTLEEPPPDSLFILVSHQPSLLPVTIRSRCQRLDFPPSYAESTLAWLQEKIQAEDGNANDLLLITRGAPLKVLDLQGQDIPVKRQSLLQDINSIRHGDEDLIKIAEKWQGYGARDVIHWLLSLVQDMARLKMEIRGGQSTHTLENPYLQALINELNLAQLVSCYDETLVHYQSLTGPYNLNEQGILEDLLIYWQALGEKTGEHRH